MSFQKAQMKVAIKQLEFLVAAKFKETNFMSYCDLKRTLPNFLADTRLAKATDPRDKDYGILSLAEDAGSLSYQDTKSKRVLFRADYRLSKQQVFINAAKAIICATNSLDVLRFAGKRTEGDNGLPTWVPDWANEEPHLDPD
jgi:hypothetical protein